MKHEVVLSLHLSGAIIWSFALSYCLLLFPNLWLDHEEGLRADRRKKQNAGYMVDAHPMRHFKLDSTPELRPGLGRSPLRFRGEALSGLTGTVLIISGERWEIKGNDWNLRGP